MMRGHTEQRRTILAETTQDQLAPADPPADYGCKSVPAKISRALPRPEEPPSQPTDYEQ